MTPSVCFSIGMHAGMCITGTAICVPCAPSSDPADMQSAGNGLSVCALLLHKIGLFGNLRHIVAGTQAFQHGRARQSWSG